MNSHEQPHLLGGCQGALPPAWPPPLAPALRDYCCCFPARPRYQPHFIMVSSWHFIDLLSTYFVFFYSNSALSLSISLHSYILWTHLKGREELVMVDITSCTFCTICEAPQQDGLFKCQVACGHFFLLTACFLCNILALTLKISSWISPFAMSRLKKCLQL